MGCPMRRLLIFSYHFPPSSEVAGKPTAKLVRRLCEQGWQVTVLVPPARAYFRLDPTAYADIQRYARIEQTGMWLNPIHRRALARIRKHPSVNGSNEQLTWGAIAQHDVENRRRKFPAWVSKLLGPVKTVILDL